MFICIMDGDSHKGKMRGYLGAADMHLGTHESELQCGASEVSSLMPKRKLTEHRCPLPRNLELQEVLQIL